MTSSGALELPARVTVSAAAMSQRLADETVVLDVDRAVYYLLDDVGTAMWSALGESSDVPAALDRLLGEYDVDRPTLQGDVARFIRQLHELGLLRPEPTAG